MLKKFINVLLCILMVLNICYVVKSESLNEKQYGKVFSDEFGDYYEDDDLFIAAQKKDNKYLALAVKFKHNNVIKEYYDKAIAANLYNVIHDIKNNNLKWSSVYKEDSMLYATRSSWKENKCREFLKEKANSDEYFNKYLMGRYIDGTFGTLYEDMLFKVYYDNGYYFRAGTKLVTILVTLGTPGLNIKSIVELVLSAKDVYELYKDTQIDKYVADINYNREAIVHDKVYNRAGKTVHGEVIFGDLGELYNEVRVRKVGYFDDPERMIESAVYDYKLGK